MSSSTEGAMKAFFLTILSLVFAGLLHALEIDETVTKMTEDLSNRDFASEAAITLKAEKGEEVATEDLFRALLSADSAKAEAAIVRILLQFDPYPFDVLEEMHLKASSSTERAYTLHLMNLGVDGESETERLAEHAKASLSDAGLGLRRYGEPAGYAPEGSRPKDVAYNILVFRGNLQEKYPIVNVDNFPLPKRDSVIEQLAADLGVALSSEPRDTHEAPALAIDRQKPKEELAGMLEPKSRVENTETESPSHPKWALMLIVGAVLGILVLLLLSFLRGRAS